ncbi:MAG: hypothetical protein JXR77_15585 [Lentisphaeria bacterium]|nr:hypothetical protein [Lentisphaeria bacterium]
MSSVTPPSPFLRNRLRPFGGMLVLVAMGMGLFLCWWWGPRLSAARMERLFAREGKRLLSVPGTWPEGRAGQSLRLGRAELDACPLYLRCPSDPRAWLYLAGDGTLRSPRGRAEVVREGVELLWVPSGFTLFVDDAPLAEVDCRWEVFRVAGVGAEDPRPAHVIPRFEVRDDFAREGLEEHPHARVTAGAVRLAQRGGGMPSSAAEMADFNVQRAVNPFAVHASDGGRLTYHTPAPERWGDACIEARFYFGIPKTGHVVDRQNLPADSDMLLAMGPRHGLQAAFGWSGARGCFVLQARQADGPWNVLGCWREGRPPLTNWVRIGLESRRGHGVVGLLDGVSVLEADLPARLRGPCHIESGVGLIEFDDVRIWSLPGSPAEPAPLLIRSRQFAGKRRKDKADPAEFDEWAASSHAFRKVFWSDQATRARCAAIVTGAAILGDVVYESPGDPGAGAAEKGLYVIGLYPSGPDGRVDIRTTPALVRVRAQRSEGDGWLIRRAEGGFSGPEEELAAATLVLGRVARLGDRFCVRTGGDWVPVSGPVPGPVHLAVVRVLGMDEGGGSPGPPDPAQHGVRCTNLVHELFEAAPTAWNWVDGAFRMDCRWACQDQWNFMACGSTGLPAMTGKRVFEGDQLHEAFLCLRATFPWDAGDTSFEYDPARDRANDFRLLASAHGWYNRHDLNLSFCSDGRNPFSGYCVVFGGEENTVTRLLRRGVPVAESREARHLFPREASFMVVHYPWWKFTVRKIGARVRVDLDDEPLFDFTDPEPIDGGHLGFWSVRNGFAVSRVSSMAERIRFAPHAFYVDNPGMREARAGPPPALPPSRPGAAAASPETTEAAAQDAGLHGWRALVQDSVALSAEPDTGLVRVTNAFGGGFFGVRWVPPTAIDLGETPCLELPLRLGRDVRVSLHLEIGGRPFLVRIGECPLAGMKAFLVPGSERGECFQLPVLPESTVRSHSCLAEVSGDEPLLRLDLLEALQRLGRGSVTPGLTCLTVGNSSNAGYLMAGNGGNPAGSTYRVGMPVFRKRTARADE